MKRKLEDYLTEELSRTGYPLEIEISSMFDKTYYLVSNNEYFYDWEEGKAREIDIAAIWSPKKDKKDEVILPFRIVHRLVIECKRSDTHAWIFLTLPKKSILTFEGNCIGFDSIATKNALYCFMEGLQDTCKRLLHYDSFGRISRTYAEIKYAKPKGQKSRKNEIFEAKNQLVKFIAYDIFQFLRRWENYNFDPKTNHLIWMYHPTIVFDGKLYEALVENGSMQLLERKHLLLSTKYSPKYIEEFPNTETPDLDYLIDVVRKDYFSDFLKILENEYTNILKCILNNLDELSEQAKETFQIFKD